MQWRLVELWDGSPLGVLRVCKVQASRSGNKETGRKNCRASRVRWRGWKCFRKTSRTGGAGARGGFGTVPGASRESERRF